jgi:hypothetical protein
MGAPIAGYKQPSSVSAVAQSEASAIRALPQVPAVSLSRIDPESKAGGVPISIALARGSHAHARIYLLAASGFARSASSCLKSARKRRESKSLCLLIRSVLARSLK